MCPKGVADFLEAINSVSVVASHRYDRCGGVLYLGGKCRVRVKVSYEIRGVRHGSSLFRSGIDRADRQ